MLQPALRLDVAHRPFGATLGAYVRLTKPRVIELLLVTAVPPMVLAHGGIPSLWLVLTVVVGGALAAGGANTINCWIERDRDQLMRRTHGRPLPQGEIVPSHALTFGIVLNVVAFVLLATTANLLAASLTLAATLFYVFVYTLWLKPRTTQNIVIGGAAGAVPALVGWAAVRGDLAWPAWLLFAVVFFWTPAHFWALAMKYRDDYEAAGIPMLPVVRGVQVTTRQIAAYAMVTVSVTFALTLTGDVGQFYAAAVLVLGALFVTRALALMRDPTPSARSGSSPGRTCISCWCSSPLPSTPSSPEPDSRRVSRVRLVALLAVSIAVPAVLLAFILLRDAGDKDAGNGRTTPSTDIAPFDRSRARVGHLAPDFQLTAVDGNVVRLSQFRGRAVVLTFFVSWCHPCEEELPVLEAVQRDEGNRLAVIAVNYQDFPEDTRRFVERLGITYPALIQDATKNPVAARYGVHGIPVTFFIDARGEVATEPLFGESSRDALQPGLDKLLG